MITDGPVYSCGYSGYGNDPRCPEAIHLPSALQAGRGRVPDRSSETTGNPPTSWLKALLSTQQTMLLASRLSSNRAAAARLPTISLIWLIAGGWAAVTGLSFVIAYVTGAAPLPSELPWGALLSMGIVSLGLWIGATIAAFWVARQLTAERYTTATNLWAELLTG